MQAGYVDFIMLKMTEVPLNFLLHACLVIRHFDGKDFFVFWIWGEKKNSDKSSFILALSS